MHTERTISPVEPRETLFTGGTIVTMESAEHTADSLAIRDHRIVAVGSEADVRAALLTSEYRHVDLGGRTVFPGFVDAHCHPLMFGQFLDWTDCSWESCASIDDVVIALQSSTPTNGTIRGRDFHHGNVAEQRMLSKEDLDRVSTELPVIVFHSSGHGAIVNTAALRAADVDESTPDPEGGHLGRTTEGALNGEVWDAAVDHLAGKIGVKTGNHGPNFHVHADPATLVAQLGYAQNEFHRVGVTTVIDAQVSRRELSTYLHAAARGTLQLRVRMLILSAYLDGLEMLGLIDEFGNDDIAISGVKFYVDGALTAGTARFSEPYCCRGDDSGYLYHSNEELADLIRRTTELGLTTATHAQGDEAIGILLDILRQVGPHENPTARHRIEHCGYPLPAQIDAIRDLEAVPIIQPQYLYRYGDELTAAVGERANDIKPAGLFEREGIEYALSSDAPVCPPLPFEAVYAAVARRTLSGRELGPADHRLDLFQALYAHTRGAARSIGLEGRAGVIRPGAFADFIVLAQNPLEHDAESLLDSEVLETWVNGELVYQLADTAQHAPAQHEPA